MFMLELELFLGSGEDLWVCVCVCVCVGVGGSSLEREDLLAGSCYFKGLFIDFRDSTF